MKRVKQEDSTGCGIACIAMLAQKTYKKVKDTAVANGMFKGSRTFHTDENSLRQLACYFNIKLSKLKDFTNFVELPNTAILAINYKKGSDTWHWVIYCKTENEEFVYDPKESIKSEKRTDWKRIKPKWFLYIE